MNVYQRGTAVGIVQRFWRIDPTTQVATLANPDTVVFTVEDPDSAATTYAFGTDAKVTNPETGVFVLALPPGLPTGAWRYRVDGTGAVEASDEGLFYILPSGVLAANAGAGPQLGPCTPWINGEDVANGCADSGVGADTYKLDTVAAEAAAALFEISGRRFNGLCVRKVRPTRDNCRCWGPDSLGLGPWGWSTFPAWGSGSWRNESGDQLGCAPMSRVRLAGYPVREILEVKIDGAAVAEFDTNGNRNWRLDRARELVRMDDPGPPQQSRLWPSCQNMSLDDSEDGTFSVTYRHGTEPPQIGRDAAAQLACQLWLAFNGQDCQLPVGVVRAQREGTTIDRGLLVNWFDPTKATGLVYVDLFLRSYWQRHKQRRSAVFSPDVQQYARPDTT